MQINKYLVHELQERNLWDEEMRTELIRSEGSVQTIERIPDDLKCVSNSVGNTNEIPYRNGC